MTGARLRRALRVRLDAVRHRGTNVRCTTCGRSWRSFKPDRNRPGALCWRCGSHERHRAQVLLFQERPELLGGARAILHFAPEYAVAPHVRAAAQRNTARYLTADLDPSGVDLQLDITDLDLPDAAFDAVICSHVLEHVPDDAAAMRELRRITAADGWCLVMVPLDLRREVTYEDATVVTPSERLREFLQEDHVRLYAPDIAERLRAAGFGVEVIRPLEEFGAAALARHGLLESDWILLCRAAPANG